MKNASYSYKSYLHHIFRKFYLIDLPHLDQDWHVLNQMILTMVFGQLVSQKHFTEKFCFSLPNILKTKLTTIVYECAASYEFLLISRNAP